MKSQYSVKKRSGRGLTVAAIVAALIGMAAYAGAADKQKTSFMPVDITESFASIKKRLSGEKAGAMQRQK